MSLRHSSCRWIARAALLSMALATVAAFAGCAGGARSSARRLIADGDYDSAALLLGEEERLRPNDAQIKRELGMALLLKGRNTEAAAKLEEAHKLAPKDGAVLLQLGRAYESLGRLDDALGAYASYPAVQRKDATALRARIEELTRRKLKAEVDSALARERHIDVATLPANTVAVFDFVLVGGDTALAPLGKGLSAMLITDLHSVSALRVVERAKIRVLLDEMQLGQEGRTPAASRTRSLGPVNTVAGQQQRLQLLKRRDDGQPYYAGAIDGAANPQLTEAIRQFQQQQGLTADGIAGPKTQTALDGAASAAFAAAAPAPVVAPETAPRLGALVGARRLVQGGYTPLADEAVRVDAALTDVTTGSVNSGAEASGRLARFFEVEKNLLEKILGSMNVPLTPDERHSLLKQVPTRDFLAFLSYSRGLDLEDRGDTEGALGAYREALRRDSGFAAARDRVDVLSTSPAQFDRFIQTSLQAVLREAESRTRETLTATGGTLGQQVQDDRTQDQSQQSQIEPQANGAPPSGATITVTGTLPKQAAPVRGGR